MNNPAAQTALGPMVIVAAEQHERITVDPRSLGAASPAVEWSDRRQDHAVVAGSAGADRRDREEASRRLGQLLVPKALHRRSTGQRGRERH